MKKTTLGIVALVAVLVAALAATSARAQQQYSANGEALNLCRIWDFADVLAIDASGNISVNQAGNWSTRTLDGSGTAITSHAAGGQRPLDVTILDGAGSPITSFGGGVEYAEDTAHVSGDTLKMCGVVQQSADAALSSDGDRSLLQVDASGYLKVNIKAGAGSGGTASNFGAAFPAAGTAAGFSDGTNMQGGRAVDADTGGGTVYVQGVNLLKQASGGPVEAGTSADPLRVDPTGSTTQPVSGTVTANQGGAPWSVAGPAADGAAVSGNPVRIAGKDGAGNTQDISTNASGNVLTFVNSLVAEVTSSGGWKAEDAGHTSGDTGMFALAVRQNASGAACADGDYCALQVDTNGNLKVAVTGASGGTSSVDNSAWTFGTSTLTPSGAVVDDVATNAVTENSVGAPRMSGQRILYVQPSSGTSPATPFDLDLDTSALTANRQATGLAAAGSGGPVPLEASIGTNSAGTETGLVVRPFGTSNVLATASWTSATAINTAFSSSVFPLSTITVTLTRSGAISSGTLNFECSIDGSASWFPWWITIMSATTMTVAETFTMVTPPDTTFSTPAGPCTNFRVRLNPTIAGAGTINLQIQGNSAAVPSWVGIGNAVQLATGTNTIGALTANQSVNTAQFGGTNVSTGTGAGGAGIPRVTVSNDSALANVATIGTSVTPGTAAANLGKAEDAGHTTADVGVMALGVRTDPTTTAYTSANTEYSPIAVDYVGAAPVGVHPGRFSCFVQAVTVMTQCQAAPAAGLRAYVTSFSCSNDAATVQTIDIVFGTGANCVTVPTALTHKYQMGTLATTTNPLEISAYFGNTTPLVPTAANAICVRPSAATAFGCTLTGFIAP